MKKRIISFLLAVVITACTVCFTAPATVSAAGSMEGIAKASAIALISKGVSTIPVVGPVATGILVPVLNKILKVPTVGGISGQLAEVSKKLDEIMVELGSIKSGLSDISTQIDSSTQEILDQMFKSTTFDAFNTSLTSVAATTDNLYNYMRLLYKDDSESGYATSELYKTLKVAELIPSFSSTNSADYVNTVTSLAKYIDGTQVSFSNKKGIFENAYLAACSGSVLGGEAAMRVSPYLNQVSGALGNAYKLMLVVLECKIYIAEHYDEVLAACDPADAEHYDKDVAGLMQFKLQTNYQDRGDLNYWKELVSENEGSFFTAHNRYFGETDSIVQAYNDMVENHWFDYIEDCTFSDGDVSVSFFALSDRLGRLNPQKSGLNRTDEKSYAMRSVEGFHAKIKEKLDVGFEASKVEKIIDHIAENKTGVFVTAEEGKASVKITPLEILKNYGFTVPEEEGTALFVSSEKCSNTEFLPDDRSYFDYHAEMYAHAFDCSIANGYTAPDGQLYTPKPEWKDVLYYSYKYDGDSKTTTRNEENDYILYFFNSIDTVEINDEYDFVSFVKTLSGGRQYHNKVINLNCDLDLSELVYESLWPKKYNGFRGTFHGNGHTIYGYTDRPTNYSGLFRYLADGANISDLNFEDVDLVGAPGYGCGVLAGRAYDSSRGYLAGSITVKNVNVLSGTVVGKSGDNSGAGGIIGSVRIKNYNITECSNFASISSDSDSVGGIVGRTAGWGGVTKCTNGGTVTASKDNYAGGIVGLNNYCYLSDLNLTGCTNTGNITGRSTGGILGDSEYWCRVVLTDCTNEGKITAATNGGGIAGWIGDKDKDPVIVGKNCTNKGEVIAENAAGGIVGMLYTDNHEHNFSGCTNYAPIVSKSGGSAGGIIGMCYGGGNFTNCRNLKPTSASSGPSPILRISGKNAGGIIGYNEDDPIDMSGSYNEMAIIAEADGGGIAGYLGNKDKDPVYNGANCENKGSVTAKNAGGIVGNLKSDGKHVFSKCKNYADVRSNASAPAGGIIGMNYGGGDYTCCENYGLVTSSGKSDQIIGKIEDDKCDVTGCVYGSTGKGTGFLGGTLLSEGSVWIIIAAVIAVIAAAVAAIILVKKKKAKNKGKE